MTASVSANRPQVIAGWILSILLVAFLLFSAIGKFTTFEGKEEMFNHLGWTEQVMTRVGIVEVVIAVAFLIPRISLVAAILLSAYLGGAVSAHVRVGDPFFFPIIMGAVMWVALGLRDSRVFQLAFGSQQKTVS